MKKSNNTLGILLGMLLGILAGALFGDIMVKTKVIGDIFLRLIQMCVVVLVMGSVIESVGSLKHKEIGRLGLKAFAGFATTTLTAATIGILLSNLLKPGSGINTTLELTATTTATEESLSSIILNFFPSNIMASLSSGNTIQVIIFALLFGLAVSKLSETTGDTQVLKLVKNINVILLTIIKMLMKLAPLGIFSLLGWVIGSYGLSVIFPLLKFLLTLAIGTLVILGIFITLASTYAKVNPFKLIKKLSHMGIVAFTTTSSAVTLPTKMADSENKLGISPTVSRLINPLGMSLNSDGLALYLAIACITIAQFFNIEMSIGTQFTVVIMSTLATLGTVVVPGGGLVALAIVLPTVGLPIEGVALLAGIDWFSGMFRTLLNVIDDVLIALIVAASEDEIDRSILEGTNSALSSTAS